MQCLCNLLASNLWLFRLMHQRVAPNKMFFTIIVQTFSRMKYESNPDFKSMLQYLDHTEKHVLPMFHDNDNDYEINVYRVLLWSTRSAVFWRAKMKEQGTFEFHGITDDGILRLINGICLSMFFKYVSSINRVLRTQHWSGQIKPSSWWSTTQSWSTSPYQLSTH